MTVKTPCIGLCSTGLGDSVCKGCNRFVHEVVGWNGFNEEEKSLVLKRLNAFSKDVMGQYFEINNPQQLQSAMDELRVRHHPESDDGLKLYQLLTFHVHSLSDSQDYGFTIKPEWQQKSLVNLYQLARESLYTLSQAHFDRYFPDHHSRSSS